MKRYNKYLIKLPFIISAICILIYIIYTIHIKLHPSIIVTDAMLVTLKILLAVALISLFIGLFIIFIRKLQVLNNSEKIIIKEEENNIMKTDEKKVVNKKSNMVISENVTKEKVIITKEKENKLLYTRCPECDGLISDKAAICPHCGILFDKEVIRVLKKYENKKDREETGYSLISILINVFIIIIFVIFIILISNILVDKYNKNYKNFNIEEKQK